MCRASTVKVIVIVVVVVVVAVVVEVAVGESSNSSSSSSNSSSSSSSTSGGRKKVRGVTAIIRDLSGGSSTFFLGPPYIMCDLSDGARFARAAISFSLIFNYRSNTFEPVPLRQRSDSIACKCRPATELLNAEDTHWEPSPSVT